MGSNHKHQKERLRRFFWAGLTGAAANVTNVIASKSAEPDLIHQQVRLGRGVLP